MMRGESSSLLPRYDAFISHQHGDHPIARALARLLARYPRPLIPGGVAHQVFLDEQSMAGDEDVWKTIENALDRSAECVNDCETVGT
jgi:hypothetical protein